MFGYDGRELAAVFMGGAIGTVARAAVQTLAAPQPGHWPWATFAVNIVGAFVLGYVAARLPESTYRRPLLGTGFCGGLTTFSTLQVELLVMVERRHYLLAAAYAAASITVGLIAAAGASRWARR
ncbi:fluoride efflux transporter CrcB [Mycobacterium deserti]|uniref:Fluoride-specific ion channel FluC n=1 Tax=Mycobacterium deserti TaxID=2978347 RepID=A0ABT2MBT2_9MYCO|nr:fluoride efflux transporter CrcB [Mycobacterium deserti]MCT7659034.1 fluoride efflux transporter CrcB [Mycobacterium deserti]